MSSRKNYVLFPKILAGFFFSMSHPASPAPPLLPQRHTQRSHTTHHTPLITHTTHHTPLITHHSPHTTHHTPLITHHSSHTPLISHTTHHTHHSSHTTHHTPLISHHSSHTPLITHHSPHTTHHTPLITHHSSHTTHLTPLILHYSSHTTHHTPLITHHSSDTTDSLTPLEGLVVAWSALVGCGRRRRCPIVNRSRSGSVRGSGGCLVGAGRLWSGVGAGDAVPL